MSSPEEVLADEAVRRWPCGNSEHCGGDVLAEGAQAVELGETSHHGDELRQRVALVGDKDQPGVLQAVGVHSGVVGVRAAQQGGSTVVVG